MADTVNIAPALTPEEWGKLRYRHPHEIDVGLTSDGASNIGGAGISWDSTSHHSAPASFRALAALAALANAALPDDDPRKITREDVENVRGVAEETRTLSPAMYAGLTTLAAKLAALLPPE